ncbi:MAG: formate--tetrahydrofolate ligase [Armatimonadota bacterium]
MLSDIEIAQQATMEPVQEIAEKLGVQDSELELYGRYKAKIDLSILDRLADRPLGKLIVVTAITPTPLGEGKTVTTLGLSQAMAKVGLNVCTTLRQPSLGPVFGIKGGAAGGGYSQVLPMEDFNLHFTGDIHAISAANNLLAAFIDASLKHGNPLNIDPFTISWRRVVDISDGWALRNIVIGLGADLPAQRRGGVPRETGYDISVASEVMAILALTSDLKDIRKRLARIIVARDRDGKPVTAEDLKCAGAMTVLMKDALKPNLIQTLEHTPVLVHAGPFANIAHGNNSIIADRIALRLADYVVTEAGFGADMGAEKFCNVKCRIGGLKPSCAVVVATVRALKMHSGRFKVVAGKPLDPGLQQEDLDALSAGIGNLEKQVENMRSFGIPVVVAINNFPTDTPAEIEFIRQRAIAAGAFDACLSKVFAEGGAGGEELARAVAKACDQPSDFRFTYADDDPIKTKIEKIAKTIYGADGVSFAPAAEDAIKTYNEWGLNTLPVCMAKTHLSLSHDPALKGRPTGFTVPVRDIRPSAGAGFLYALCGEMATMPSLPSVPAGTKIDIDEDGNIVGLF